MPLIKNKTKQLRVFAGSDPETNMTFETVAIPIGQAKDVPDELWSLYKDQPSVRALLESGRLRVLGGAAAAIEPAPDPEPKPDAKVPSSSSPEVAWADKHYKTCKAEVAEMTDVEKLYQLLDDETRPAVKSAIEERIEELGA